MRSTVTTVLVLAAGALLAGCSGGGDSEHVAALPGTTTTKGSAPTTFHPTKDPYKASVQYVNCMRDHGIDLPDPDANGDIHLTPADEKRIGPPGPRNEAADEACFHFLRGAVNTRPLSDQARSRMADVMLQFSRCMRRHGWEFGDPVVENMSRGRVRLYFPHEGLEVQAAQRRRDPQIAADQRTCERGQAGKLDKAMGNQR
jgi:hypothetical protein